METNIMIPLSCSIVIFQSFNGILMLYISKGVYSVMIYFFFHRNKLTLLIGYTRVTL